MSENRNVVYCASFKVAFTAYETQELSADMTMIQNSFAFSETSFTNPALIGKKLR